jgi:hypothetical protein
MAIVYRNGRPYFYQSQRQGGRVVSRYCGKGEDALLFAEIVRYDRQVEAESAEFDRQEKREADNLERALTELAERARTLAAEALSAAGYHLHHRGEWRKRRGKRLGSNGAQRIGDGLLREDQAHRMGGG